MQGLSVVEVSAQRIGPGFKGQDIFLSVLTL